MKITKYAHSFITLEKSGELLVIDPGVFTPHMPALTDVSGIIITHEHSDHLSIDNLNAILDTNPRAKIYAPQDVVDQLDEVATEKIIVTGGDKLAIGPFDITFVGGDHAVIYQSSPCKNVGIYIDGFYYSGDSLDTPVEKVEILAVPATAPWMKVAEAMDFITDVKPRIAFPVHNMLLSEIGESVNYRWLKKAAQDVGAEWRVLADGEMIES